MRVTIVRDDNTVIVDGESHTVACGNLPLDFHALQWDGARGEIEYNIVVCDHCHGRNKRPNEIITDLSPYKPYIDVWSAAKIEAAEAKIDAAG